MAGKNFNEVLMAAANLYLTGSGPSGVSLVQGSVADDAAAGTTQPVPVGGNVITTTPAYVNGDRATLSFGTSGVVMVGAPMSNGADGTSNGLAWFHDRSGGNRLLAGAGHVYNGATWDRQRGDVNAISVLPGLSSTFWNYAAASGGITNTTTAVTIKAAAGAGIRNYISSLQIVAEALGAATEIAIRDGAGGNVLWRSKIGTAGWINGREIEFSVPLKGSANTLLEIVTLTASVTGSVYVNAQGFTGA